MKAPAAGCSLLPCQASYTRAWHRGSSPFSPSRRRIRARDEKRPANLTAYAGACCLSPFCTGARMVERSPQPQYTCPLSFFLAIMQRWKLIDWRPLITKKGMVSSAFKCTCCSKRMEKSLCKWVLHSCGSTLRCSVDFLFRGKVGRWKLHRTHAHCCGVLHTSQARNSPFKFFLAKL